MVLDRYAGERVVNIPNAVTAARIVGGARAAWQYHRTAQLTRLWASGGYFSFDLVDGWLARRLDQTTQAGGDLDKVGDKITGGLLLAGARRHGSADRAVLALVAGVNGSNVAATLVGLARATTPTEVPDLNRKTQALMQYGLGFNMIGNHMRRESSTAKGRGVGHALRWAGGASAVIGAGVLGSVATARLWRTVLRDADEPRPPTR
jgi:phosphatidylglycerophosphate synthase